MRFRRLTLVVALAALARADVRVATAPPTPVLVELFTSEGCSSCPPADRLLAGFALAPLDAALVVPLGEHVDYWDELGWRDRFSSAAFTARQQTYARRLGGDGPYTPQLVIDGRVECVGSDAASARKAIARAAAQPHGTIAVDLAGSEGAGLRLTLRATNLPQKAGERADVLVAITENDLRSDVTRGENRGHVLTHAAVVRQLSVVGEANGSSATVAQTLTLSPNWRREALHLVAFVQERRTGGVLAAATVPLVSRP